MSGPYQQLPPPAHAGWGPVGPVLGALAAVLALGAMAVAVGRLCSGRQVLGYGHYDVEGWMEAKCASCIDGTLDPPPPATAIPVAAPAELPEPPPEAACCMDK